MNTTHKKDLTLLEQAVLTHLYLHNIKDWTPYYLALFPNTKAKEENLPTIVSHFRRSARVQQYWKTLQNLQPVQFSKLIEKRENENGTGKEKFSAELHDFTNIDAFLQYCNDRANSVTNERDRQQYLKFISDLLSFKNSGPDTKQDIQRFYTPLQCSACPLYIAEKAKKWFIIIIID